MTSNPNNKDEIFQIFVNESNKLESIVLDALSKSDLSVSEIIQAYYQTTNVNSLAQMLMTQLENNSDGGGSDSNLSKIKQTQKFISEKFDQNLHPFITKYLTDSIADMTKQLQSSTPSDKSKEDIENEAKTYEQLREMMSTKEFVEQYDKGLR